MKVLVIGASGMLGSIVAQFLRLNSSLEILEGSRTSDIKIDLADKENFKNVLLSHKPNAIINLAALADVDACEKNPSEAFKLNSLTCKNLSIAVEAGIKVIHVSTDHVYNGIGMSAESEVSPLNYYAYSKLLGETYLGGAVILRTNFFGKSLSNKKSFSDWIYHELKSSRSIGLFKDSFFSPMNMTGIAKYIGLILIDFRPGIYNLGCRGGLSKYEFGLRFARLLKLDIELIKQTTLKDAKLSTNRPFDMRMDISHFESAFNTKLPSLEDLLNEECKKYMENL